MKRALCVKCPYDATWCATPRCVATGECDLMYLGIAEIAESKAAGSNRLKLWWSEFRANWRDMLRRNA